jgi:hypothetical protein
MKPTTIALLAALTLFTGGVARADYAQEVLKDGPVAWCRFQDSACTDGAAAKDETGRHPGVYRGGVTLEAGPAPGRGAVQPRDGTRHGGDGMSEYSTSPAGEQHTLVFHAKSACPQPANRPLVPVSGLFHRHWCVSPELHRNSNHSC